MADVRPTKLQNDGNGYGSLREFADGDTVPVALGGTGAPTAAGARTSLGLGALQFVAPLDQLGLCTRETASLARFRSRAVCQLAQ